MENNKVEVYRVIFKAGHSIDVSREIAEDLWKQLEKGVNAARLYSKCSDNDGNFSIINVLDISLIEPIYE